MAPDRRDESRAHRGRVRAASGEKANEFHKIDSALSRFDVRDPTVRNVKQRAKVT
jgi:hypothetical protein